jgi:hypothetical protein
MQQWFTTSEINKGTSRIPGCFEILLDILDFRITFWPILPY